MLAELTAFADLSKRLIALVKEISSALPEGEKKEGVERQLKAAVRELALAEASTAKELGYALCKCTFPPQIMLYDHPSGNNVCARCGNTSMAKSRIFFD